MGYYDGMMTWGEQSGAPVLPAHRVFGHQAEFRRDPIGLMLRAREEGGDLVQMRMGPAMFHLLSDPAEAYAVLVEKHKHYSKRTPGYDMLRTVLGEGLLTSEGELWRRQRRIAQPAFNKKAVVGLTEVMRQASTDLQCEWEVLAKQGAISDIAQHMAKLTLRIAGETLFAVDLSDDSQEVSLALTKMMRGFTRMMSSPLASFLSLPTPANLRSKRALVDLDRVVNQIIAERKANPDDKPTLLNMFLDARDEDGNGMSDKQLRDEVLTTLLAGHETTANALSWTFYMLSKHPAVARRLEAELDEVLDGQPPTMEQVKKLPYTTQVIKETMRLYPPAWTIGRRAEEEDEILGHHIPKGALVMMSPYVIHRHPDVWDNPEGFDPDRFAPGRPAPPRGAFLPFIVGPRKCIGEHFAMTEAVILVATLLSRHRVDLMPGHKVELEPSVTLRPKNGIKMRIRSR